MFFLNFSANFPIVENLGQSVCLSGWQLVERVIDSYEFIMVKSGTLSIKEDGQLYTLSAGEYMLMRPWIKQLFYVNDLNGCKFYYCHFHMHNAEIINSNVDALALINNEMYAIKKERTLFHVIPKMDTFPIYFPTYGKLGKQDDPISTLLEKCFLERDQYTPTSRGLISAYIYEILCFLSREYLGIMPYHELTKTPKIFHDIVNYINKNYHKNLKTSEIAYQYGISQQYLIRIFNKSANKTPIEYINILRLYEAKQLMRETNCTLSEIAYSVGFENPSYFSRLFKKYEGISPTTFRNGFNCKNNE